jgi:chaperonin cofactor prefoldin
MKLSITYKEIENKVKDLTKVSLSLSKVNENTLNVKYSSGMMFLPNIEISLIITAIYSNKIELTYSCKPLMEIAVEKLLPKLISNLPKGVIEIENKTIKVDLEEIEQAKKVLKFLSLSDIVINDEIIEVFAELK